MASRVKVLWLVALAVLVSGGSVLGETAAAPRTGLELAVTVESNSVLPGEPVGAVIILRNSGTEAVPAMSCLDPIAGTVRLWIEDPSGLVHQLDPILHATVGVVPTLLYPGEELTSSYTLVWDSHEFPFSEVGRNRLVATYADGTDTLVSAPVEVAVLAPVGREAEASRLILNDPVGEFLRLGGYDLVAMADLNELLDRYLDSRYAPYAAYALALRFSRPGLYCAEPGSGELERIPPDYTLATEGFQDTIAIWPGSAVADDAQLELARTYSEMGDMEAAGAALADFFEQYGGVSDRLGDAVKLGEKWGWEGVLTDDVSAEYVALRELAGESQSQITWLPDSATARVIRGKISLDVQVGRRVAVLGDRRIPLTAPARLEQGRMLVPRSFAQLLPRLLAQGRQLAPIPLEHLATVVG